MTLISSPNLQEKFVAKYSTPVTWGRITPVLKPKKEQRKLRRKLVQIIDQ